MMTQLDNPEIAVKDKKEKNGDLIWTWESGSISGGKKNDIRLRVQGE